MRSLGMIATPLVVLILAGHAGSQSDGSFWWLKETTEDSPESKSHSEDQPPCECVKYYLCVNDTISTSGIGLIDIRVGGNPAPPSNRNAHEQCPDLLDVCCMPPKPEPTVVVTTPGPTLPSDTPCECVSLINCTAERLVSDGRGNTSLEAFGVHSSHSACPHAFTVCCASEATTTPDAAATTTTTTSSSNSTRPHCDCVDPYLCDETGTIVTSGGGLMDLRTLYPNPNPEIQCENRGHICCNLPTFDYDTTASQAAVATTAAPETTEEPTSRPNCGSRNPAGIAGRIFGFKEGESQFGEFPWVAAILRQEYIADKPVHLFVGGGTLIHSKIIVTAAHKIHRIHPTKLLVRLGEWDTQTQYETYKHQNIQVEEVVIHPNFNPRTLFNDVAVLIMKEEVKRAPHINHICLAGNLSHIDTTACVINGWGKDGFEDTSKYQAIMKSLSLPLVGHQTCQKQLRTTRLGRYFRLHDSFICAGGEMGKDACTGDGGGPLACPRIDDPSRYLLVGITAWGIGCGEDGIPGVYASIPANYEWILNETYGRFPTITTTTTSALAPLIEATTSTEFPFKEDDYVYSEEWQEGTETDGEKNRRQRQEKKQRKEARNQKREERERQREERTRRREERERRRAQRAQQNSGNREKRTVGQ